MNLHAMGSTTDASRPGAQLLPHHIKNNIKKSTEKRTTCLHPNNHQKNPSSQLNILCREGKQV